jgi:hypothetical protein
MMNNNNQKSMMIFPYDLRFAVVTEITDNFYQVKTLEAYFEVNYINFYDYIKPLSLELNAAIVTDY